MNHKRHKERPWPMVKAAGGVRDLVACLNTPHRTDPRLKRLKPSQQRHAQADWEENHA